MRIRQSTLNTWMTCPLQAKFRHLDLLPRRQNAKASFGTIIHHCLEVYNSTDDLDKSIDLFKDLWENPEKLGVTPDVWPKFTTAGGLRQRGVEILQNYHDKNRWETREIVASEHGFLVPFGDHELEGTVDLLEVKKNKQGKKVLRVVDFKTNAKLPTQMELRVNTQFTTYVYASLQPEFWQDMPGAYEKYQNLPRRAIWYALYASKELDAGERDDGDFMRLYRVIDMIEKAIENDVYVPNISGSSCTFCDYTKECGLPIPQPDDTVF